MLWPALRVARAAWRGAAAARRRAPRRRAPGPLSLAVVKRHVSHVLLVCITYNKRVHRYTTT